MLGPSTCRSHLACLYNCACDAVLWLQPENCGDPGIFEYGLSIAADLNAKYFGADNRTTITLSQRDVPGMTRSVIPLLVKHGVQVRMSGLRCTCGRLRSCAQAISVGVNPSTAPPAVPKVKCVPTPLLD